MAVVARQAFERAEPGEAEEATGDAKHRIMEIEGPSGECMAMVRKALAIEILVDAELISEATLDEANRVADAAIAELSQDW